MAVPRNSNISIGSNGAAVIRSREVAAWLSQFGLMEDESRSRNIIGSTENESRACVTIKRHRAAAGSARLRKRSAWDNESKPIVVRYSDIMAWISTLPTGPRGNR